MKCEECGKEKDSIFINDMQLFLAMIIFSIFFIAVGLGIGYFFWHVIEG